MPIEIAHYTLTYEEEGRQENYRVLRIIQPGDMDILFDAGDITGVSEPLRFWGERLSGDHRSIAGWHKVPNRSSSMQQVQINLEMYCSDVANR